MAAWRWGERLPKGMYLKLSHAWSVGVLLACEQVLARDRVPLGQVRRARP
ncbi:hypothetical protein OHA25_30310 [Nonomuraea sp. NBC_00507]